MKLLQSPHRILDKIQHLDTGRTSKAISGPRKGFDIALYDLDPPLGQRFPILLPGKLNHVRAMIYPASPLHSLQDHLE